MKPHSSFHRPYVAVLLAVSVSAWAGTEGPVVAAREVAGVALTVSNLEQSVEFFTSVLDFERGPECEVAGDAYERLFGIFPARIRLATLRLGAEKITLMEFVAPEGRPIPVDSRSYDHWFQHIAIVVSDMDRAYARLREFRVRHISSGPQTLPDWNPNAGGIRAFYFKDPDGHVLELIGFPEGKGDPRWRRKTDRLFLGIDHTAIGISDTPRGLEFYRDALGLRVAGAGENFGIEQERLNGVFGARLEITGLRAAAGPGVEFLDYLAPGGGRPYPIDSRANDLWHWHTTVVVPDVDAAFAKFRARRVPLVSPEVIALDDAVHGRARAFLARDPDGHAVFVTGN